MSFVNDDLTKKAADVPENLTWQGPSWSVMVVREIRVLEER